MLGTGGLGTCKFCHGMVNWNHRIPGTKLPIHVDPTTHGKLGDGRCPAFSKPAPAGPRVPGRPYVIAASPCRYCGGAVSWDERVPGTAFPVHVSRDGTSKIGDGQCPRFANRSPAGDVTPGEGDDHGHGVPTGQAGAGKSYAVAREPCRYCRGPVSWDERVPGTSFPVHLTSDGTAKLGDGRCPLFVKGLRKTVKRPVHEKGTPYTVAPEPCKYCGGTVSWDEWVPRKKFPVHVTPDGLKKIHDGDCPRFTSGYDDEDPDET